MTTPEQLERINGLIEVAIANINEVKEIVRAMFPSKPVPDETWLSEVNEKVPLASDQPEEMPGLPNLTDVKPLTEVLKERMELEETPEGFTLIDRNDPTFEKMACYLISKPDATEKWFIENRAIQKVCYYEKDRQYLLQIIQLRDEFLKGENGTFDFNTLLAQCEFSANEKAAWKALKEKYNLK